MTQYGNLEQNKNVDSLIVSEFMLMDKYIPLRGVMYYMDRNNKSEILKMSTMPQNISLGGYSQMDYIRQEDIGRGKKYRFI